MTRAYECAYCGTPTATTTDHIPAKGLFAKEAKVNLLTVKACAACNLGASADDQYFRDTVLKHHRVSELPQAQSQIRAMLRSAAHPRKRGYTESTLGSFVDVEVRTPAGLHLGVRSAFRVDGDRLKRTAERYIRGLHRYALGRRVPDGAEIAVAVDPEAVLAEQEDVLSTFAAGTTRIVQPGVFYYTVVIATDNPEGSGWLLVFFDEFAIIGSVRPRRGPDSKP